MLTEKYLYTSSVWNVSSHFALLEKAKKKKKHDRPAQLLYNLSTKPYCACVNIPSLLNYSGNIVTPQCARVCSLTVAFAMAEQRRKFTSLVDFYFEGKRWYYWWLSSNSTYKSRSNFLRHLIFFKVKIAVEIQWPRLRRMFQVTWRQFRKRNLPASFIVRHAGAYFEEG